MDWKDKLESLKGNLPEGESIKQESPTTTSTPKIAGGLKIFYEKKGRAGKPCTIITGFDNDEEAKDVASKLKRQLGIGGSCRGCEILLQGDQRPKLKLSKGTLLVNLKPL